MAKSNAGAIEAGRAFVKLFVDGSDLVGGLLAAGQRVRQFGASITFMGLQISLAAATMMAPLIKASSAFKEVANQLRGMNQIVASALFKAVNRLNLALKQLAAVIMLALAPALIQTIMEIIPLIREFSRWIVLNQDAVVLYVKVAAILFGVGLAMIAVGKTITALGAAFVILQGIWSVFASSLVFGVKALVYFMTIGPKIIPFFVKMGAWLAIVGKGLVAFLLSPITLVVGALGLLTAAYFRFTSAGQDSLIRIAKGWEKIKTVFKDTWGAIVNAVLTGDLTLAFSVVVASLKFIWIEFKGWFKGIWIDLKFFTIGIWDSIIDQLKASWISFTTLMQVKLSQLNIMLAKFLARFTGQGHLIPMIEQMGREEQLQIIGKGQEEQLKRLQKRLAEIGDFKRDKDSALVGITDESNMALAELNKLIRFAHAQRAGQARRIVQLPQIGNGIGSTQGTFNPFQAVRFGGGRGIPEQIRDRLVDLHDVARKQLEEIRRNREGLRFN